MITYVSESTAFGNVACDPVLLANGGYAWLPFWTVTFFSLYDSWFRVSNYLLYEALELNIGYT